MLALIAFRRRFLLKEIRSRIRLRQANEILEEQKSVIQQKNKDITDSIKYAEQIQMAVLPDSKILAEHFEHFIFYKPKDIVSGDFYWFIEQEGKVFIAAVDCTGHGVPGAFMSLIGNILLNQIIVENQIFEVDEILNQLRLGVIAALKEKKKMMEWILRLSLGTR